MNNDQPWPERQHHPGGQQPQGWGFPQPPQQPPPPGVPPQPGYGQPDQPAWPPYQQQPGTGYSQGPSRRPPGKPWIRRHPIASALLGVLAVIIVAGIGGAIQQAGHKQPAANIALSATTSPAASAQPTVAATRHSTPARRHKHKAKNKTVGSSIDAQASACDSRPDASGDIYVWILTPGLQPDVMELGGQWRWDYATNKCLTSVQLQLATAPAGPGTCTQVGYVADNPGYDPNVIPPKRLKVLAGEVGPAC